METFVREAPDDEEDEQDEGDDDNEEDDDEEYDDEGYSECAQSARSRKADFAHSRQWQIASLRLRD